MRTFTLDEANRTLHEIKPKLIALKQLHSDIDGFRQESRNASSSSNFSGGMRGGTEYVSKLFTAGQIATEIADRGVELKDYSRGLIDFPSERSGRIVLLCWELSDGDEIEWWHEVDDGYAGRQPI
jgi:hypothetical protein